MREDDGDIPSRAPKRSGGLGRRIWNGLLAIVFLALFGGVLYLVSERNAHRYYLVPEGGKLVVKRGMFMPRGETPYTPEDPQLAATYAPIDIPQWVAAREVRVFEERAELDVALADLLISWARELVKNESGSSAAGAIHFLERARRLPATTAEQQRVIKEIEREVAFFQARGEIDAAIEALDRGLEHLKHAAASRGASAAKSLILLPEVEAAAERLRALRANTDNPPVVVATSTRAQ